ncbi:MAG: hypothetical protein AUJ88_02585 [Gallionellaceae bacterium CG1_02_56_997]|nr:MAG: hypothetical protein AUJ88_02585 [Gallionellaceae bacterium CG1_02_56_997]PIY00510.1 MAG: hypothetical protein COZ23_08000 [Hydrogenophilales bacterium CG_4_10_14_3_um_filter_58_23]
MKSISHKIIDTIKEVFILYINARFVRGTGSRLMSAGLVIFFYLASSNVDGSLAINVSGVSLGGKISSVEIPGFWHLVASVLILTGASWMLRTEHQQRKREEEESDRKVVLAVQIEGYSNVIQSPVTSSVPPEIKGKRIPIMINVRDALLDGHRLQDAADDVTNIERTVHQHGVSHNSADINICAGGLAPVPFLFMLGNILEDHRPIHWAEWDRKGSRWTWSNEGVAVQTWGLPNLGTFADDEIVLKSGITYGIADKEIAQAFPGLSVIKWEPAKTIFEVILDEHSCLDICEEFKTLMRQLKGQGVKRVHFLLACSTALTMRLGSVLDPRNMPEVIVYQYEKNSNLIYTWGLGVKVHEGRKSAIVIDRRKTTQSED